VSIDETGERSRRLGKVLRELNRDARLGVSDEDLEARGGGEDRTCGASRGGSARGMDSA
jgi:hypothetical protein